MKSILTELRILVAEALLAAARGVMPKGEPEAKALDQALADYAETTAQQRRWEKFPA